MMSERNRLGVGVIGIGWVAGEHIKAFQANSHCDVVALASQSHENALAASKRHGLDRARVYTDYQDLLADDRVDVVVICSTNERHEPQAIAAAEAGKHLLIEKPVALTWDGALRVQDAIEKAGVKSQGGFELNWGGYFQSIQHMIDAGFFGNIFYAECDYFSGNWAKWYSGFDWVRTKKRGGAALTAAACHAVDAVRQFVRSDAVEVFAYSGNFTQEMEWDPVVLTSIRFANGAIGKVGAVLEGNVKYTFNVRLHGPEGALVNDRFLTTYLDPGLDGWAQFPTVLPDSPEVIHHPFPGEANDLIDSIIEDRDPKLNIREDLKTYQIIFAAERSAHEGKPVTLPLR